MIVLDMAAVIHITSQRATVFGDYIKMDLMPYLHSLITGRTTRVDALWDKYIETSLKSQTGRKRGRIEQVGTEQEFLQRYLCQ